MSVCGSPPLCSSSPLGSWCCERSVETNILSRGRHVCPLALGGQGIAWNYVCLGAVFTSGTARLRRGRLRGGPKRRLHSSLLHPPPRAPRRCPCPLTEMPPWGQLGAHVTVGLRGPLKPQLRGPSRADPGRLSAMAAHLNTSAREKEHLAELEAKNVPLAPSRRGFT